MSKVLVEKVDKAAKQQGKVARLAILLTILTIVLSISILIVFIDYFGRFNDPGLRWLASGSLLAITVYLVTHFGKSFWYASPTRLMMAQKIEVANTQLGSQLSNAIAFYDQSAKDTTAGSEELRRAVILETDQKVQNLEFSHAVNRDAYNLARNKFGLLLSIIIVLFFFVPDGMTMGYKRLLLPWSSMPWPRDNHLVLIDPPKTVTQGETIDFVCLDEHGTLPDDLTLEFRVSTDSGYRFESNKMSIVGSEAVVTRQNIQSPLEYRAVGGDDHTMAWHSLEVLEPPSIDSLSIEVFPPEYSGLLPFQSSGRLEVLSGSKIALKATSSQKLSSTEVILSNGKSIPCRLENDDSTISLNPEDWVAVFDKQVTKGTWQLSMQAANGSTAVSDKRVFHVIKDGPPAIKWTLPAGDAYLTTRAIVPIEVQVTDDLAVASCWIDAKVTAIDDDLSEESVTKNLIRHDLLELINDPPTRTSLNNPQELPLASRWDLEPEKLPPGTRLDLVAKATDFFPLEGSSKLPRRIFLVTDDEFQARLAKKQSRLLATVQESIDRQRNAFELAESLASDLESSQERKRKQLDQLASIEFEQRQAASQLTNQLGAIQQAENLLEEIKQNRMENDELQSQFELATKELKEISSLQMTLAKNSLAETRRNLQRDDIASANKSIQSTIDSQLDSKEKLEKVAKALTGWSDFQRLSQELASIEKRQRDLAERSSKLALQLAKADPLQRAESQVQRKKLSSEQAENNRRFNQIQQTLNDLLSTTNESKRSESQNAAADALQEAKERNIAGGMRAASSRLARNQLGRASQQQLQSADDLREMLETLRSRANSDPKQLIVKLQEAQEKLQQLEQQAQQESDTRNPNKNQADQIANESKRMARKLDRLTAQNASQKANQAADSASRSSQSQSPSAQSDLKQSAQALKQAQEEVDNRIAELQEEQAERLLDRLEKELPRFQQSQQAILDETKIGSEESLAKQREISFELKSRQTLLFEEIDTFSQGLAPKPVFQHALVGATDQMQVASNLLNNDQLGRPTQRSEYMALQRLRQIEQVLKTHREQKEEQQQQGGGQGGPNGEPPKPLPFEVAELKMLRLMQLELIDQTRNYQADRSQAVKSGRFNAEAWKSQSKELSEEQNQLSELALEMANRNNEP